MYRWQLIDALTINCETQIRIRDIEIRRVRCDRDSFLDRANIKSYRQSAGLINCDFDLVSQCLLES